MPRETDEINGPLSNKDYVCVAPETVSVIAESIGIPIIGDDIAASLAEDVSYKLQEIINSSCTIMRRSKRRKLLMSDVASALRVSNVNHILGHSQKEPFGFVRLPEAEIYVADDKVVDLIAMAKSTDVPKIKKPSYVATSYPILQSTHALPVNGHAVKTDGKSFSGHVSKLGAVNGDVKMETTGSHSQNEGSYPFNSKSSKDSVIPPDNASKRSISNGPHFKPALSSRSKLNGCVRFAPHQGIREKLKRDTEEELKFSQAQLSYFKVIAKSIIEGPHRLFEEALATLRQSRKANAVSAPLLNFVALSVCHIPRHFGFLSRVLETIDVLLCNVNISPTHSIAVNRLVNALLAITADQNILRGKNDFLLRRWAAQVLTRVLLVWGIEEQHVSELLSRVARVLGDSKEKIQSHFGALVIFQSLGKAALGWLSPLLKCFLPLLEKRSMQTSVTPNIQMEEIRGVLLDIVELLYCDVNAYRFKIKASTIQETQAMIHLDMLLYQYCGDAVCARRRPSCLQFQQSEEQMNPEVPFLLGLESNLRPQVPDHFDLRLISYCARKIIQDQSSPVFEETFVSPFYRRKDIQFKFAGANPVPRDGLRKKVYDKTQVQFSSVIRNQSRTVFPQQYLIVGHSHRGRSKRMTRQFKIEYSLYNVI